MSIGENIKKYRKMARLTQRELAEKCGLATGTIQQYELGKRQPRIEQIKKIAKVLNVAGDELFGANIYNSPEQRYVENYTYHIFCLLLEIDEASKKQDALDNNLNMDSEESRVEYAALSDFNQFALEKALDDLQEYKHQLEYINSFSINHEILISIALLNDNGKKKILDEIENLSYNPKYKISLKEPNFDPYELI